MLTGEINVDMGVHVWGEEADQINGGSRLGIITARSVGTVTERLRCTDPLTSGVMAQVRELTLTTEGQ